MGKVRIVTDSAAQFVDPSIPERYGIVVLPHSIGFNVRTFRETVDLDPNDFFRRLANGATPTMSAPAVEQFRQAYAALSHETDSVLSIHISQAINGACANARAAAQMILGRCNVHVLDSMLTSVGLGFLVEAAARLAETGESLDSLARIIRKQTGKIFTMAYTDSLDGLHRAGVISDSHALLSEMLGMRILVTVEDGQLVAIEKARNRGQALDKLVEFVAEFNPADRLVVMHAPAAQDTVRLLQARLIEELHWTPPPVVQYLPSFGMFVGPEAIGVTIHQRIGGKERD